MARTKVFDEEATLDRAMALFWERGYEATSVRDLIAHAGISSSSLYATFGDKHDVYGAALDRYRLIEREQFAATLNGSEAIRPMLAAMFADLIDVLLAGGNRGSFTLNAAIELGGRDEDITARLRDHFDDICVLLEDRLVAAQDTGEISDEHPPGELARYLAFGLYSLATMVKIYPNRAWLEGLARMILATLDCREWSVQSYGLGE